MEWRIKQKEDPACPSDRESRTICRFLFWPLTIDGTTKWLETVKYQEQFYFGMGSIDWSVGGYSYHDFLGKWHPQYWIEEEE